MSLDAPLLCQSVEGLERMHLSGHEGIGSQRRHDPPAGRAIRSIQPSSNARGGVHEDCETSHLWCNNDCVCVWRDLSHPLDGPAAPRRRLRRLSSVVDGPAQSRAIPLDAWNNFTGDMGGTTRSTRLCLDGACSPTHADMAA